MTRQILIETSTQRVLKHGFMDMTQDPEYDPAVHAVVEKDFVFDLPIWCPIDGVAVEWTYNSQGDTFTHP